MTSGHRDEVLSGTTSEAIHTERITIANPGMNRLVDGLSQLLRGGAVKKAARAAAASACCAGAEKVEGPPLRRPNWM
jgi:hypothetical protein